MAILQDLNIDGYLELGGVKFNASGEITGNGDGQLGQNIIFKNGNVGFFQTDPQTKLHINVPAYCPTLLFGTGTNIGIDSNKDVLLASSSRKVKENFQKYEKSLVDSQNISGVLFNYIGEEKTVAGLLAEDLHENNFSEFVNYDLDNLPFSISYETMFCLIINCIRELQEKIKILKAKIELI